MGEGDAIDAEALTEEARRILVENDRGGYTVPSARLYPFQWNWDSMFLALGWAEFDRERAWREIDTLLEAQWPSGMVPHIVFWTEESTYFPGPDVWRTDRGGTSSSGISQPPVAATVMRRLSEAGGELSERRFDAIDRWHRWWHRARDPEGRGVMAVVHPWESGRDNLPDWDQPLCAVDSSGVGRYNRRDLDVVDHAMRPHKADYDHYLALVQFGVANEWDDERISLGSPFRVADPGVTAILLRAERDLAWMGRTLGRDVTGIEERIARLETGFEQFWNPAAGTYCSFDLLTGVRAEAGTSASFLAPYAGVTDHLDELVDELTAWSERCRFLVPSFDPRHDAFEPLRYWRGPVWSMMNYLIATGLHDVGHCHWAERIRSDTRTLIGRSGMPESFDPIEGGPVGGPRFTWTAAMWLTWAGRE